MNLINIVALPLGCIFFVGVAAAFVWGINRMRRSAVSVESAFVPEGQGMFSIPSKKYLPHLLSPLGLTISIYLVFGTPLWIAFALLPELGMLVFLINIAVFTAFSAISPILNIFLPRKWLNAILFIPCWYLLSIGILAPLGVFLEDGIGGGGLALGPPMIIAGIVFPISLLIQVVMFFMKKIQSEP